MDKMMMRMCEVPFRVSTANCGKKLAHGGLFFNGICWPSCLLLGLWLMLGVARSEPSPSPLPSWQATPTRDAILDFTTRVATPDSPDWVPPEERVAVMDLDGTLLCEKPHYVGGLVAEARLREKAADPGLAEKPLYAAALEDNQDYLRKHYQDAYLESFLGESQEHYQASVVKYLREEVHPRFERPYGELVFQPMLELVRHLESCGFRVYVVSTSNQEFIRAFASSLLGLPPEQVIGSVTAFDLQLENGEARFLREKFWFKPYNAGKGKALRIRERTGRIPLFACGNGTGDLPMLQLAAANPRPHLVLVLDHDDAEREYEYHKTRLIDAARENGWPVISMKQDFGAIFGD